MRSRGCEGLAGVVDALAALDLDALCVSELQSLVAGIGPQLDRLAGVKGRALGELVARSGGSVPSAPHPDGTAGPAVLVRHWLRELDGRAGAVAAGRQVREAELLRQLPLVQAAVLAGSLPLAQALLLTRFVGRIEPSALAEAEPNLIAVAGGLDPQELAPWVNQQLATWCEPQFDADVRDQDGRRYLQTSRETDGMLSGRFRLPAADAEGFLTVLEPLARPSGLADDRSAGQRRADALVEVFGQVLRFGELPDAGGFRPQISYVLPAGWAAGAAPVGTFAELVGRSRATDLPDLFGEVALDVPLADDCPVGAWTGPQTRTLIEALLCDARLTRVLLDTRGQVSGLETLGDTVTKAQRRALAARDLGCAVRGCTRPPSFCDAHHLDALADGGATTLANLVLLCRRHHVLWHRGRLQLHHLHVPWITGTHDPPF